MSDDAMRILLVSVVWMADLTGVFVHADGDDGAAEGHGAVQIAGADR